MVHLTQQQTDTYIFSAESEYDCGRKPTIPASVRMRSFILTTLTSSIALLLCPSYAQAQEIQAPNSISACQQMENDAQRLACYDTATNRQTTSTETADKVAENAKEIKQETTADLPLRERIKQARTGGNLLPDQNEQLTEAIANAGKGSLLDSRWELAKDSKLGLFNLRAYKPVYIFPVFWSSNINKTPDSPNPDNTVTDPIGYDSTEAKFQISFKTKAMENIFGDNGDLWLAYTQSSRWQVYNSDESRPFRETNYEPEALLVFRNNYSILGWKGRMAAVGLNHQSNGRSLPLSRSWNRVMFNVGLDRENWSLMIRPWIRISEEKKDDDNHDITDYMGRGDVTLVHTRNGHILSLMGRHSFKGGDRSHGALQFDWGFPITNQLRGHVQVFDGYGESMIDYNHRSTYIGMGISLLDWY